MLYFKKYYSLILQNYKSHKIFYRYYDIEKTYIQAFKFTQKIFKFIKYNKIYNKKILTFSNKSFEMYSSIFPILLSGNTWIPLSINLPQEKIKNILDQTNPDVCFYDYENEEIIKLLKKKKIKCINYKKLRDYKIDIDYNDEISKLDYNSIAFIYFTSGSTGLPKGIKVTHKNIISDIYMQQHHLYNFKTKGLVFADYYDTGFSIFFDIYFPAIFFGSTISPSIKKSDNFYIINHYKKNKINNLIAVPSTFERIKKSLLNSNIKLKGKNLILTGEPFYLNLLSYIFKKTKFNKIFNCYGGTEMGNWVFFHQCRKGDNKKFSEHNLVPIGKPFKKVKAKIINKELVVQGPMITDGYMDQNLNYKKFKFDQNNTFYTGDKVVRKHDVYICKGRKDNMIKISGYRIEIADVEANFRKLNYIQDVVIFEKKSKKLYRNSLTACVSMTTKKSTEKLKKDLKKYLSDYMIPKEIFILSKLPKNSNGKLDRAGIKKKFSLII